MIRNLAWKLGVSVAFLLLGGPVCSGLVFGQAGLKAGKNDLLIRGQHQAVYFTPGGARSGGRPLILYAPGDGGWRGFAVTLATSMASWGYDVCGLDTKRYLESFTGKTTLKAEEVTEDMNTLATALGQTRRKVILVGWSEGAGLLLLGAAGEHRDWLQGLVTIGLGEDNALGWRFVDNLTYLTKSAPNEPTFQASAFMSRVSPLPVALIQSTKDEYVTLDESKRLFGLARDPKRFVLVAAEDHRFQGNREIFFQRLLEVLTWIEKR